MADVGRGAIPWLRKTSLCAVSARGPRLKGFSLATEGFPAVAFHDRSRVHCGESLMSLRGVAMLYERIMATRSVRRAASRPQCTRCIDIHRERHPISPCRLALRGPLLKARAPRPGDARTSRQTVFPSSFPSPLVRSFVHAHGNICLSNNTAISNKGSLSKNQQTSRLRDLTES